MQPPRFSLSPTHFTPASIPHLNIHLWRRSQGQLTPSTPDVAELERQAKFMAQRQLRSMKKQEEQASYQMSALLATSGVMALAICATYWRFSWHMRADSESAWIEMACTLLLVFGGVAGMEAYARFAHKSLWHDFEPGWALHKSHHEPRTGPFEANDIFAIANGLPAFVLCAYGFLTPNITGGLCFGAGLGITLFGIMYMFVHDGLVHKRFPVGEAPQRFKQVRVGGCCNILEAH